MAANLPADSATVRAIHPPEPDDIWTLDAQLLARIADELAIISYVQQRKAGGKPKRPRQIPRPGITPDTDTATFGGAESALPIDEMSDWLGAGWNPDARGSDGDFAD